MADQPQDQAPPSGLPPAPPGPVEPPRAGREANPILLAGVVIWVLILLLLFWPRGGGA
jgi:hypothetical protein